MLLSVARRLQKSLLLLLDRPDCTHVKMHRSSSRRATMTQREVDMMRQSDAIMQAYVWILVLVRHHQPSLLRSRQLGSPSLDQNVVMVVALKQVPRFGHVWGRTLFVPEPCPRIKKICIVVPVIYSILNGASRMVPSRL